jgi:hypothetical protein
VFSSLLESELLDGGRFNLSSIFKHEIVSGDVESWKNQDKQQSIFNFKILE